ncbi:MAG: WD40 repeat domain-containing protein [Cyclobacteriaceae bacterium]
MKIFSKPVSVIIGVLISTSALSQSESDSVVSALQERIRVLELTEIVQSMTQRSLLTPGYHPELKALIAAQAYNFWKANPSEKFVSHLNVYSALHYANKYLQLDSTIMDYAYNQILGHNEMVISIELGSDSYFYSAGSDGKVLKWDINNPKVVPTTIFEGDDLIRSIDISHDERFLMILTKTSGTIILDIKGNEKGEINQPMTDPEVLQAASFLPGKDAYISVNRKGEIKLTGLMYDKQPIGQAASRILSIAIDPAQYEFYLGSEAGNITKADESGKVSKIYFDQPYAINSMDISNDNHYLAIGRELGDAVIWDLKSKEQIRTISGHQSGVMDVEFSPDSKTLLTASRDGTARIWDIDNPRKFPLLLDDHNGWVMTAAFNKDGSKIITGCKDNFIRIWEVNHKTLADRICQLVDRNMTSEEWSEYVGENIPYQTTCP